MDILIAARLSAGPFPHDNRSGWSSPWAAGQRSGIVSLPRDGVSPVGFAFVANRRVDGAALRQARLKAGLTMSEVAEAVGVADGARIGAWEHGLEQPHPRFIPQLAKVVKLPVTALLVGKGLEPSLADLRLTKGLTLTELASSAGIPRTTCHRLEQGVSARVPDQASLSALASALDSSSDAVLAAIVRVRADRGANPRPT
jgi:transcriptional regulator with XRE-family HTH domain